MNEKKQLEIKNQAKQILEKFASKLSEIHELKEQDFFVDIKEFERKEGSGKDSEEEFKKDILNNAPKHDADFIIAERGDWNDSF